MGTSAVSMVILLAAVQFYSGGVAFATAFGCKNTMIGDEWREMILNIHNDMRRKLAKGQQAGQNGALPYAKNMKQLYWDCTFPSTLFLRKAFAILLLLPRLESRLGGRTVRRSRLIRQKLQTTTFSRRWQMPYLRSSHAPISTAPARWPCSASTTTMEMQRLICTLTVLLTRYVIPAQMLTTA
ncbi:hypothetical protein Aduo_017435 [Ancylostoma duodenale]